MNMDSETLLFLLKGGHINMPDRIARGLWPHPPLSLTMIADYLASILENSRWFPRPYSSHQDRQFVWEGATIENRQDGQYVYRSGVADPIAPTTLRYFGEKVFLDARAAALYYLRWEMHLPGALDGWAVVPDREQEWGA